MEIDYMHLKVIERDNIQFRSTTSGVSVFGLSMVMPMMSKSVIITEGTDHL